MNTDNLEKDINIEKALEITNIMDGRNKFILNNNMCIIETISFQDNIMLNNIIRPVIFSNNYDDIPGINAFFIDRLSFMDKFKILCKIADYNGVDRFKKIDKYLKMRNNVAHNLTSLSNFDYVTKENDVIFANQKITWTQYKEKIKEWAELSLEMAKFILNIYSKINNNNAVFAYCKVEGDCVLVQHNLIYPEPGGDYKSFFRNGFNMDLLNYLNREIAYSKETTD